MDPLVGHVELSLPPDSRYMRLARLMASGWPARAGCRWRRSRTSASRSTSCARPSSRWATASRSGWRSSCAPTCWWSRAHGRRARCRHRRGAAGAQPPDPRRRGRRPRGRPPRRSCRVLGPQAGAGRRHGLSPDGPPRVSPAGEPKTSRSPVMSSSRPSGAETRPEPQDGAVLLGGVAGAEQGAQPGRVGEGQPVGVDLDGTSGGRPARRRGMRPSSSEECRSSSPASVTTTVSLLRRVATVIGSWRCRSWRVPASCQVVGQVVRRAVNPSSIVSTPGTEASSVVQSSSARRRGRHPPDEEYEAARPPCAAATRPASTSSGRRTW